MGREEKGDPQQCQGRGLWQEHHGLTNWSFAPGIPRSTSQLCKGTGRAISPPRPSLTSGADSQDICAERKQELFPFYFIFITNCSHRHEKPQKKHAPFPTAEFQKQGLKEKAGRQQTPLTAGHKERLPHEGPAQGTEQEPKTTISLPCDLEQVTNSPSPFSPHLPNGENKGCSEVRMR